MPTQRKITAVAELTDKLERMQLGVVASYRGMSVPELNDLRAQLRQQGAEMIVAKNTLLRIAARATGNDAMEPLLAGPTAVTFAYDDVAKIADLLEKYIQKNKKLEVRGSVLGNAVLPADALKDVAKMPSRDEVLAQIVGGVQSPLASLVGVVNAPVADVASLLNAVVSDIALVVQARADQLREQGDAAPAA